MSALTQDIRQPVHRSLASTGRARRAQDGTLSAMARSLSREARTVEDVTGSVPGVTGGAGDRLGCAPSHGRRFRRRPLAAQRA